MHTPHPTHTFTAGATATPRNDERVRTEIESRGIKLLFRLIFGLCYVVVYVVLLFRHPIRGAHPSYVLHITPRFLIRSTFDVKSKHKWLNHAYCSACVCVKSVSTSNSTVECARQWWTLSRQRNHHVRALFAAKCPLIARIHLAHLRVCVIFYGFYHSRAVFVDVVASVKGARAHKNKNHLKFISDERRTVFFCICTRCRCVSLTGLCRSSAVCIDGNG